MIRRLALAAVAISTLVPAAVSAADLRSVTVPAAAADFDARVMRAARIVCGPRQLNRHLDAQVLACRTQAVADARSQREAALAALADRIRLARAGGVSVSGGQN